MKKTSFAAFYGINAWVEKCLNDDSSPEHEELERMRYISSTKEPIDEVGQLLQTLPRIDQLRLSFQARDFNISFAEFLLDGILTKIRNAKNVRCFYVPVYRHHVQGPGSYGGSTDESLLQRCVMLLSSAKGTYSRKPSYLPSAMEDMFWLLQAIQSKQQRDPSSVPPWITPLSE